MNIVFWLCIVFLLALIWFCLSPLFKGVGEIGYRLWDDARREMYGDDSSETKEE